MSERNRLAALVGALRRTVREAEPAPATAAPALVRGGRCAHGAADSTRLCVAPVGDTCAVYGRKATAAERAAA